MVTSTYNQPQISVKDQIELLKSDGLIFQDEERARHLLENVSMFRMKIILIHLDNEEIDVLEKTQHLTMFIRFICLIPN
jgi:abortive infection bacteriophage resistance protein